MKASPVYSSAQAFIDTFVAPTELFSKFSISLQWAKWCAVLVLSASLLSTYYFFQVISVSPETPIQLNGIAQLFEAYRPQLFSSAGLLGLEPGLYVGVLRSLNVLFLVAALGTAYWAMQFTVRSENHMTLMQWYKIIMVCQLPWVANYLGLILLTFSAADTALPFSMLDYASVNYLFFQLKPQDSWYTLIEGINLFHFWSLGLTATAINRCLKTSLSASLGYALLPYIVLASLWTVS